MLHRFDLFSEKVIASNIQLLLLLWNYKTFVFRVFLVVFWIFLYNNNMLILDRIKIFIVFVVLIFIYKIIYNYFEKIYKELLDESMFYVTRLKYLPYESLFTKIIPILLLIQKWRNPFLVFLAYTDKKIFNVMRFFYEFLRFKGLNQEQREVFNLIIIYFFYFGVFKILLGRFYIMLGKWFMWSFIEVFFFRVYGLLLSVLIFSNIIDCFRLYIMTYGILGCILLYVSISFIFVCIELFCVFEIYNEKTSYFGYILSIIKNALSTYMSTDLTIYHRMHYTILGRIITIISEIILDIEEDDKRLLPNAIVGSYKTCIKLKKGYYIYLQYRYRYSYKYMDHISCYFLIKHNYLETSFLTYWTFLKRNYYKGFILLQDRKNYPSAYLFHSLVLSLKARFGPIIKLIELYYYKLKCQEYHLVLNAKESFNLDYLYKFDMLRLKIILFMIWDILKVIDFDKHNWIQEFKGDVTGFFKWSNWNILWNVLEIKKDSNGLVVINVNQEISNMYNYFHFFKQEMKLYDIESNLDYFVELFNYLGYVKTDYAYDNSDSAYKEMCGRYYISKKLESYSDGLLHLWQQFSIDLDFNRVGDALNFSIYEASIEAYFNNVIIELRQEWLDSIELDSHSLAQRNVRLLSDLQFAHQNIKK